MNFELSHSIIITCYFC